MPQSTSLDSSIASARAELERRNWLDPQALLLLSTGSDLLPERLDRADSLPLGELPGCPTDWRPANLIAGELGGLRVWVLDDLAIEAAANPQAPPFAAGWPCWLAARAGALFLIHVSAGAALDRSLERGALVALADHLNLSGRTPLTGLAESRLGPLFPDVSRLHDVALREGATAAASARGLPLQQEVASCAPAPSLQTRAEREYQRRAGAAVSVQGLADPLLAAAHAGLRVLSLVAVVETSEEQLDLRRLLAGAEQAAPAIEELLIELAPNLVGLARDLEDEL